MFCRAVRVGSRLKAWNTNPTLSRRTRVSARSSSAPRSTLSISTHPEVTLSRPARQCMSVDLPDPDGPMTAEKLPRENATSMPSTARTALSPSP